LGKFVLVDSHGHYLREDAQGNYIPVDNWMLAKMWDNYYKAKNVLQNSINKNLRARYHVKELTTESSDEQTIKKIKPEVEKITPVQKEIPKPTEKLSIKSISDIDLNSAHIDRINAEVDSLTDFITTAEERKTKLRQALSEIDLEDSDIEHFIELNNFDMYKAYILCLMLKERLIARRKVKDELFILGQLSDCKVNSVMLADMKSAINGLTTRQYAPRRLTYIFENANKQWKI